MNPPGPLPPGLVDAYVAGTLDAVEATRVEQRLAVDPLARRQVNAAAVSAIDPERLDSTWWSVEAMIDAPRRGWFERFVVVLGMPADIARLMGATPSMRRSWYLAIAGALFFGLVAAGPNRPGGGSELLFLVLAPLIPVMGVALAYGPGVDPAHEITVAAPISGLRLVLLRVAAVLGVSMGLGLVAAVLLGRREGLTAVAWMVPAFGLSMVCLALTTFVRPRTAGWLVAGAWVTVASQVADRSADPLVLFRGPGQVVLLVLGLAGLAMAFARRATFDLARVS